MKYLIVSDIHGSLPALEKVLAFYREQQCDLLCILGDILNYCLLYTSPSPRD